jgi:hypothetical protein
VIGLPDEGGPSANRLRRVGSQAGTEVREGEVPVLLFTKDPNAGEGAQQAIEHSRVGIGGCRQVVARARTIDQEVGDAEHGGDVDGLRDLIAVGQAPQRQRRPQRRVIHRLLPSSPGPYSTQASS